MYDGLEALIGLVQAIIRLRSPVRSFNHIVSFVSDDIQVDTSLARLLFHSNALIVFLRHALQALIQILDTSTFWLGQADPGRIPKFLYRHNLESDGAMSTVIAEPILSVTPGMSLLGLAKLLLSSD